MPEQIKLQTGNCQLCRVLAYLVTILAAAGIIASAAPPAWKIASLVLLLAAAIILLRERSGVLSPGSAILYLDGTAVNTTRPEGVLLEFTGHAWLSSLFSVIHFREPDSGRKCSWLVCAANNHSDDYRRMLGFLRLSSCAREAPQ